MRPSAVEGKTSKQQAGFLSSTHKLIGSGGRVSEEPLEKFKVSLKEEWRLGEADARLFSLSLIPDQDSKQRHVESGRWTAGMATLETREVNTNTRHTERRHKQT